MQSERTWALDSVEEGVAAIQEDGGRMTYVPAWLLPAGAREGDLLRVERSEAGGVATIRISVDAAATAEALRRSREQLERARGNDPGGNIVL